MGMGWLVRGCGERLPPGTQLFEGMEQQRFMAVLIKVAAVGRVWLHITESGSTRKLQTFSGSRSDLAIFCLIHVDMMK